MIQNIKIEKLHNHPKNPRKDLGDLTELAESIKVSGVLQNLTIVPWFCIETGVGADDPKQQEEMGYFVVIGNRRLGASQLAGLKELPCVISDMDYKTQVATMLLENMQRSDLTVYEQAQGFQMMLDLGDSVSKIAERTGFSETTVRHRVKLLELNDDKFKKSIERGGTLMDYIELEKIQDKKMRNSVLEKIGTSNFRYELQRAIDKEVSEKNAAVIIAELEKFAVKTNNCSGMVCVKGYAPSQMPEVNIPDDADKVKYFFVVSDYGYITLYKKSPQINSVSEQSEKEKERASQISATRSALEEISKRAYQLRHDFIFSEISNSMAKKNMSTIIEYTLRAMLGDSYYGDYESFIESLGINISEEDEDNELGYSDIAELVSAQPERHLLIATYLSIDSERAHYYDWNNRHADNADLNLVYDLLEKLGYQASDEEKAMRNGTHELFKEK